jgi:hypothetical protein
MEYVERLEALPDKLESGEINWAGCTRYLEIFTSVIQEYLNERERLAASSDCAFTVGVLALRHIVCLSHQGVLFQEFVINHQSPTNAVLVRRKWTFTFNLILFHRIPPKSITERR